MDFKTSRLLYNGNIALIFSSLKLCMAERVDVERDALQ